MNEPDYADFEKLFRQHNKGLTDLAYNLVRNKDAAKDIVQEVFLKLWKNRSKVNFGDQIKHYLFKATAHTALNHLRFSQKSTTLDDPAIFLKLAASSDYEEIGYKELETRARQAIDKLPPKCKAIYILSRHEGLKYQEIADTLKLSLKTVENQMGIALDRLRGALRPFLTIEFIVAVLLAALAYVYGV
jgi:RNA polymerase sigma-70 factor (ECF subfamily)